MSKTLKERKEEDLIKELTDKRSSLRAFRFSISGGKAKNVREGRNTRKDIARILTELSARKAGAVLK